MNLLLYLAYGLSFVNQRTGMGQGESDGLSWGWLLPWYSWAEKNLATRKWFSKDPTVTSFTRSPPFHLWQKISFRLSQSLANLQLWLTPRHLLQSLKFWLCLLLPGNLEASMNSASGETNGQWLGIRMVLPLEAAWGAGAILGVGLGVQVPLWGGAWGRCYSGVG